MRWVVKRIGVVMYWMEGVGVGVGWERYRYKRGTGGSAGWDLCYSQSAQRGLAGGRAGGRSHSGP